MVGTWIGGERRIQEGENIVINTSNGQTQAGDRLFVLYLHPPIPLQYYYNISQGHRVLTCSGMQIQKFSFRLRLESLKLEEAT